MDITLINQFIYGGVMMNFLIISLFFFRFWQKTRDKFFLYFSRSFALLAIERCIFLFINAENEAHTWVFLIRLVAFCGIIMAVVEKNRVKKTYTPR
ncbi:DUF5985 family protein [Bdellovibrio bacteriovorus]